MALIKIEPAVKAVLKLHANESNGSIKCKMTISLVYVLKPLINAIRAIPPPFPSPFVFKKSYHCFVTTCGIRNKTEQRRMYSKKKKVAKRIRLFSFRLSKLSQNNNSFCNPNTLLRICMKTMSSEMLVERSNRPFRLSILFSQYRSCDDT